MTEISQFLPQTGVIYRLLRNVEGMIERHIGGNKSFKYITLEKDSVFIMTKLVKSIPATNESVFVEILCNCYHCLVYLRKDDFELVESTWLE